MQIQSLNTRKQQQTMAIYKDQMRKWFGVGEGDKVKVLVSRTEMQEGSKKYKREKTETWCRIEKIYPFVTQIRVCGQVRCIGNNWFFNVLRRNEAIEL